MTIKEMKERRAALLKEARALKETSDREKRGIDSVQFNKLMDEYDRIGKDIEMEERLNKHEEESRQRQGAKTQQGTGVADDKPLDGENRDNEQPNGSSEYRDAFWSALRKGHSAINAEENDLLGSNEVRSLAIKSEGVGAYVVPDEFERNLIRLIEKNNVMRQLATVITTGSGVREIPVEEDRGEAYWIGEEEPYRESDAKFGNITLGHHKLTTLTKVSEELMNDSFFNMENYVTDIFGKRIAEKEEQAFINGDGEGKPKGFLQDAELGLTAALADGIAADELIKMYHSLKRNYRSSATWMLGDDMARMIRLIKDANGQYIWSAGLQAGQPDRILTRPVVVSDFMPAIEAGSTGLAFGDFSQYYIADRVGRQMQRLNELFAATGQVGFRMYERVDGKLITKSAIKTLKLAAAGE